MRAARVCSRPGCPNLMPCSEHARPNAHQRGYTRQHKDERARWVPRVMTGRVRCWRCSEPIQPTDAWDLGHKDDGSYGGPEHAARCNRSAAGRSAHSA